VSGRPYEEVVDRFLQRRAEELHWRNRVQEFGELDSLTRMNYARERVNELAWVLEGYEEDRVKE
jgi:hypothetical protein